MLGQIPWGFRKRSNCQVLSALWADRPDRSWFDLLEEVYNKGFSEKACCLCLFIELLTETTRTLYTVASRFISSYPHILTSFSSWIHATNKPSIYSKIHQLHQMFVATPIPSSYRHDRYGWTIRAGGIGPIYDWPKFLLWSLTNYQRIVFLDADTLPLGSGLGWKVLGRKVLLMLRVSGRGGSIRCFRADKQVEVLHFNLTVLCNVLTREIRILVFLAMRKYCGHFFINAHDNLGQRVLEVSIKHHMNGTSKIMAVPLDEKGL